MIVREHTLRMATRGNGHILDLTPRVTGLVEESGIATGQVTLMVIGSTGALSTLEYEPGLVEHDIVAALEILAPEEGEYRHELTWHDDNGHSHVRATLVGPSLALPIASGRVPLPIASGRVPLGTWQQIVLLDFDTRPRDRSIAMTLIGAA